MFLQHTLLLEFVFRFCLMSDTTPKDHTFFPVTLFWFLLLECRHNSAFSCLYVSSDSFSSNFYCVCISFSIFATNNYSCVHPLGKLMVLHYTNVSCCCLSDFSCTFDLSGFFLLLPLKSLLSLSFIFLLTWTF